MKVPEVEALVDKEPEGPPSRKNSSSDSSSSDSESSGSVDICGKSEWISLSCGVKFKPDFYAPKHAAPYKRWLCKCAFHAKCVKKRTFEANTLHGDVEPIAYLLAWHLHGADADSVPNAAAHGAKACFPTAAEVADVVASRGHEIKAVLL